MANFTAGEQLTATRLNANPVEETETTGMVASTGFSNVSFSGRKVNGFVTVVFALSRTGADITEIATNSGNISDTSMCTLPSDWRPPETMNAMWGTGFNDGECTIGTNGVVTVRSTSGSDGIQTGHNVSVSARWISG